MRNPLRRVSKGSPRVRRRVRRTKNAALSGMIRFGLWAVGRLSLEQALRLGESTGGLLYRLLRKARRLTLEHLRLAFGDDLPPAARAHLARASFMNIARSFCELAKIDDIRARKDDYFEVEGREHLQAVRAEGKGAIVITGLIGNWELLAAYFAWEGIPVAAIARRIYAERLNQLLVDFRSRQGVETILRESPNSSRQILRALKNNALLAMLIDQDMHAPSVAVPFFGRLARTPAGAASLAIRRDIPAVAVFIQRRAAGCGHRIRFSPPFAGEHTGDLQTDIRALTKEFSAALETQIRSNPAEWVWWHRRSRRGSLAHLDLGKDSPYMVPGAVARGRR